jgi:hypothetical protein
MDLGVPGGECVVAEHYEDQVTGEVFTRSQLDEQYSAYVAELAAELPDVQPCSFTHWLRGELEDRLQPLHTAPTTSGGPEQH